MLDVIEGELAGLEDRHEDAFAHFERAGTAAAGNEMRWLAGLAYERLAKLARRRGHALLTQAAFDAARRAYEAWDAFAVVRRIEHERTLSDRAGS